MEETILGSRYLIIETIGGGGMAEVYKAHDQLLDREVAVKILRKQYVQDSDFVARFRREAKSSAKLSDPNIVSVFDVGEQDDVYYIVMEYVNGSTLKEMIQKNGFAPYAYVVKIAVGIAKALRHAHERNLVHCDIKPQNILVDRDYTPKVTDFGIARAISSSTITADKDIVGSVYYLSPEQAGNGRVTSKSDLYSLGVVMYEMITGNLPFTGDTAISIMMQHVNENPPDMRQYRKDVPPILLNIINKLLSKTPVNRYQNATALLRDLSIASKAVENYFDNSTIVPMSPIEGSLPVSEETQLFENTDALKKSASKKAALKKTIMFISAGVAVLLVAFFLGMYLVFGSFWSSTDAKVPNVIGQKVEDARMMIESNQLVANVSEVFDDKIPVGVVVSQLPEGDSMTKAKRTINVIVSKGPEEKIIPNLAGMSLLEAQNKLMTIGVRIGKVENKIIPNVMTDNKVYSQSIAPNTKVTTDMIVDLVIAKKEEDNIEVPNLAGLKLEEIKTTLSSQGLELGTINYEETDKVDAGKVISQSINSGNKVKGNTKINVVLAKELPRSKPNSKESVFIDFIVPQGKNNQKIKITVGQEIVYERTHDSGEIIRQSFTRGSGLINYYVDDKVVKEYRL